MMKLLIFVGDPACQAVTVNHLLLIARGSCAAKAAINVPLFIHVCIFRPLLPSIRIMQQAPLGFCQPENLIFLAALKQYFC